MKKTYKVKGWFQCRGCNVIVVPPPHNPIKSEAVEIHKLMHPKCKGVLTDKIRM